MAERGFIVLTSLIYLLVLGLLVMANLQQRIIAERLVSHHILTLNRQTLATQ